MAFWEDDYAAMGTFFFTDETPPPWRDIIEVISEFERNFSR